MRNGEVVKECVGGGQRFVLYVISFILFVTMRTELCATQHTAIAYKAMIVGLFHAVAAFNAIGIVNFMAGLATFAVTMFGGIFAVGFVIVIRLTRIRC